MMKSEMKNQLPARPDDADIRENQDLSWGMIEWFNWYDPGPGPGISIYDPVYYQLLEPLSTGVQQRFSHTFGKYILSSSGDTVELQGTAGCSTVPDCHPPGGHSSLSTTLRYDSHLSSPPPAQVSLWKMNERLQWKLLADIIIHLPQHYHHRNISSTPPHHNAAHIWGPIREQLGVRWGEISQWGLSVAVMMSNWCGILKCSFSQHLPRPVSSSGIAELF